MTVNDSALAIPWVVFAIVWIIGSVRVKPIKKTEGGLSYLQHNVFLIVGFILFATLHQRIFPASETRLAIGLGMEILGIGLTIWARVILAGNWSANVTIKEEHELTTSGPYRLVRHPIYTGILLAFLGTAMGLARLGALLAFPLFVLGLWLKLRIEERFLREQFGTQYEAYEVHSKALIPFVL